MFKFLILMLAFYGSTLGSVLSRAKRAGKDSSVQMWPSRRIPYKIHGSFSAEAKQMIEEVIAEWVKFTCVFIRPAILFGPITAFLSINFVNDGCSTDMGYEEGIRSMNLAQSCLERKYVTQQFMIVAGAPAQNNCVPNALTDHISLEDAAKVRDMYSCEPKCTPCPKQKEFPGGNCECYDCSGTDVSSCEMKTYCRDKLNKETCDARSKYCYIGGISRSCPVTCGNCTRC